MADKTDTGRNWLVIGAVVMALFIIINAISFIWFPFLPWFEQREAGEQVVQDQMDADNAIQTYRDFRQLYNDIEAQRAQVQNSYDELERFYDIQGQDPDEWSREAEIRHGRIQERITGNQNQLENLVAEYNAMSDDATQEVFKCHLPYKVDERFAITGPPGSGDADEPLDTNPDGNAVDGEVPPPEECDGLSEEVSSGG